MNNKYVAISLTSIAFGVLFFIWHSADESQQQTLNNDNENNALNNSTAFIAAESERSNTLLMANEIKPATPRTKPTSNSVQTTSTSCSQECLVSHLDTLISGQELASTQYRELVADMPTLVAMLEANPDYIYELARNTANEYSPNNESSASQDSDVSDAIMHILRQVSFSSLSYVAFDLAQSSLPHERNSGIKLLDQAYAINIATEPYADKSRLKEQLKNILYNETNMENKALALEVLANHAWQDTDTQDLDHVTALFANDLPEQLRGKALKTVAMLGGHIPEFEPTLSSALTNPEARIFHDAITAVHNLAVFKNGEDAYQTQLLATLEPTLRQLANKLNTDDYQHYRLKLLLEQHFKSDDVKK